MINTTSLLIVDFDTILNQHYRLVSRLVYQYTVLYHA